MASGKTLKQLQKEIAERQAYYNSHPEEVDVFGDKSICQISCYQCENRYNDKWKRSPGMYDDEHHTRVGGYKPDNIYYVQNESGLKEVLCSTILGFDRYEDLDVDNDLIYKVYASVILHKNPDEIESTYRLSDYFHIDVHEDGSVSYFIPTSVKHPLGPWESDEYHGMELVFDAVDAIDEERSGMYHCSKEKIKGNSADDMLFDAYMPDTLKQILGKSLDKLAVEDKYTKERQRKFYGKKMMSIAEEKEELSRRIAELDAEYNDYNEQLDSVNEANDTIKSTNKSLPRRKNNSSVKQNPDVIDVNGKEYTVQY